MAPPEKGKPMCDVNPMFHMDQDYMWRWYLIDDYGNLVAISARSFFNFEDARRDAELAHGLGLRRVA